MKHHTLPEISGLLLLISTPLCYSVSLPTGQPQSNMFYSNMFYYNCYYIFWAQRKTALAICVHHTSKDICIKKIFVLNVLFIVEVLENKYYYYYYYLTLNPWVIRKMQIWYPYSPVRTVAQLDNDLSRPASQAGELFRITALQLEDNTCVTVLEWIRSDTFPPWTEVKSLCPELRFLWHHRNNLSADTNGVI